MSDQKLAYYWHLGELILVVLLGGWAVIGFIWSVQHLKPKFVETKRPAR